MSHAAGTLHPASHTCEPSKLGPAWVQLPPLENGADGANLTGMQWGLKALAHGRNSVWTLFFLFTINIIYIVSHSNV